MTHALRELYLTRLREFYRQPARIFWVYGFPTVMAIGLGLAFRTRPPESTQVDLVRRPGSTVSAELEKHLKDYDAKARRNGGPGLLLKIDSPDEAMLRL